MARILFLLVVLANVTCGPGDTEPTETPAAADAIRSIPPWQATRDNTPAIPPGSASVPAWAIEQVPPTVEPPHPAPPLPPDPTTHPILEQQR